MKKGKYKIYVLLMVILLTGCNGAVELEKRGFAASVGVDAAGDKISVCVSVPKFDEKSTNWSIKQGDGNSLSECLEKIDKQMSGTLFLGHAKTVIIGEELLKNKGLFKLIVEEIEMNKSFGRGIIALCAEGKAADILKEETEKEKNGFYVSDYVANSAIKAPKMREIYRAINEGESYELPKISKKLEIEP